MPSIQLKDSRIPLLIGIWNPSSTDRNSLSSSWNPESTGCNLESRTVLVYLKYMKIYQKYWLWNQHMYGHQMYNNKMSRLRYPKYIPLVQYKILWETRVFRWEIACWIKKKKKRSGPPVTLVFTEGRLIFNMCRTHCSFFCLFPPLHKCWCELPFDWLFVLTYISVYCVLVRVTRV